MMAIAVQRRLMELGRIRLGDKGSKGEPKKLTKFRLTSASQALLQSAAQSYGGQVRPWEGAPDEGMFELYTEASVLDIILPPVFSGDGQPTLPYSQFFELWSGGGCQRRCDGETELLTNAPCLCNAENRACKITTRINVMLPKVAGLGVWRLESHGWNAAAILPGTLDVLMMAAAERQFIPASLRLEQKTKKVPGQGTRRFVVPVIDLPQTTVGELLQAVQGDAPLALNAPPPAVKERPALPAAPAPEGEPFEHDAQPDWPEAPALPVIEAEDDEVALLAAELVDLSEQLGARPATEDLLGRKRAELADDQKKLVAWIKRQITTARKHVEEQSAEPEQSTFAAMVPKDVA